MRCSDGGCCLTYLCSAVVPVSSGIGEVNQAHSICDVLKFSSLEFI